MLLFRDPFKYSHQVQRTNIRRLPLILFKKDKELPIHSSILDPSLLQYQQQSNIFWTFPFCNYPWLELDLKTQRWNEGTDANSGVFLLWFVSGMSPEVSFVVGLVLNAMAFRDGTLGKWLDFEGSHLNSLSIHWYLNGLLEGGRNGRWWGMVEYWGIPWKVISYPWVFPLNPHSLCFPATMRWIAFLLHALLP